MTADANSQKKLLKTAVHHNSWLDLEGLSERLFTAWFGGFFYNQIWEDPRVDRAALQLGPQSRMLTISSAGCNLLNYQLDSPAQITAVDLNPCHIFLTRLKLAAARYLPTYEDFFQFFGCGDREENLQRYQQYLRPQLDPETIAFWESNSWPRSWLIGPRIKYFARGYYDYARLGYFLRFVHGLVRLANRDAAAVLRAADPAEQTRLYDDHVAPFFDYWVTKAVGRVPFLLHGLGIPPRQYQALYEETGGQIFNLYRQRVRKLACDYPVADNYFAWQAFSRRYDREKRQAVPDYLKAENYERVKAGAARVQTHVTTLHEFLAEQPAGSLDRFVFLDSQDWMKPEQIASLWAEVARVGAPGTRVIFRTASSESPVETSLPADLRSRFVYEADRSRDLFAQDRAAIYGGFHLYVKPE